MSTAIWLVSVVVILALAAGAAWFVQTRRRRRHLQRQFGPEYDRAVQRSVKTRDAEQELERRERRVEQLRIRPLPPGERARFAESWRTVQSHFVDGPAGAVDEADELVEEVMERRGYPVGDFAQQSADLSVDHADVVSNYRAAHDIASRSRRGEADTEDLRKAMVHYRALFEDLLEARPDHGRKHPEARDARSGVA